MTLNKHIPARKSKTFRQWLAELLIRKGNDLQGRSSIIEPSLDDVRAGQLQSAQLALLDAYAEKERYCHTVTMLEERITRLQHGYEGNPVARVSPSTRT